MKKSRTALLTALILSLCLCLCLGIGGIVSASIKKATPLLSGVSIEQEYKFGSDFYLPNTGILTHNGESKSAKPTLVFPNETEFNGNKAILDQEGIYTLKFTATFSGEELCATLNFTVKKDLFSISKNASTIYKGEYNAYEHDPDKIITGQVSGAVVSLASGDTLCYNKVIDVSSLTKDDVLIRVHVTPETLGTAEVSEVIVALTDAYDPTNIVYMRVTNAGEDWGTGYASAKANCGQLYRGWEHNSNSLSSGSIYGYPMRLQFSGNTDKYTSFFNTYYDNNVAFSLDYATKQVHHVERNNTTISTVVTDLDSPDEHTNQWKGFTTGECYISVSANGYSGSAFNIVISEVLGQPVTSIKDFERGLPTIENNFGEYEKTSLPVGVVNKAYKLFDSKGVSPYFSKVKLEQKVFLNYTSPNKVCYEVIDGAFTPTTAGTYTVESTATDGFGKTKVDTYTVIVKDSITPISLELGEKVMVGTAGKPISIASAVAEGGSGDKVITYAVKSSGQSVEIVDGAFFPMRSGEYTVTITATDYIGDTKIEQYTVSVSSGSTPIFVGKPNLPEYFISGSQVELPVIDAYNYTDGSGDVVKTTITYRDSDGVKVARNGNKIIPSAEINGQITTVYYTATINGESEVLVYEVPTIILKETDGDILHSNLFYTSKHNSVVANDDEILFSFSTDAKFDFVNPIVAHGIDVRFAGRRQDITFNALTIMLSDVENSNQKISLTYENLASGAIFYVNGDKPTVYNVNKKFTKSTDIFSFTVNNISKFVKYDRTSTQQIPLTTYVDGSEFKGFESGFVNVSFAFTGVTSKTDFAMLNINGKSLYDDFEDFIGPKLSVLGEVGGVKEINSLILIPKAVASDVIDGKTDVRVSVVDPDGNYCYDVGGTQLNNVVSSKDFNIEIDKYGTYVVRYVSYDSNEESATASYKISVDDEIAPVITVVGTVPTTAKAKEQVVVPSAYAVDNYDLEIKMYICLVTDTGNIINITGRAFTPIRAGVYTIRYYCFDKAGNMALVQYELQVD